MDRSSMGDLARTAHIPRTLGDEEEAWYYHDPAVDSTALLHCWICQRSPCNVHTANPLADDEDAWARQ